MERIVMVNNSAIVNIIERITSISGTPCKKTLQKIVFLIEAKHVDLGCDYGIYFYGPYSADLDYAVRALCDEGILKIDYSPIEHLISVIDNSEVESYSNETVNSVISSFGKESPAELELIATALYVYLQIQNKNGIKDGVKKIKGNKYSDDRINMAINKLIENGYITE